MSKTSSLNTQTYHPRYEGKDIGSLLSVFFTAGSSSRDLVTGQTYITEDLILSSTWSICLDSEVIMDPSSFFSCCVCVSTDSIVWVCLLNNKGSQYILYYKGTWKAKLSPSIIAWLRQRLLFELLCLSKDTSFVLLRSMSTPFVIVHLKGISLPL